MKVFPTFLFKDHILENSTDNGYIIDMFLKQSVIKYGNITITDINNCDVIFLIILCCGEYVFDVHTSSIISSLKKPIIIFDYIECGQQEVGFLHQYNIFGYKVTHKKILKDKYIPLNDFLLDNQSLIKCYFKRELPRVIDKSLIPFRVVPIDYIAEQYYTEDLPDTWDEYNNRPCLINFVWGRSNFSRIYLYSAILSNFEKFSYEFALSFIESERLLNNPTSGKFMILIGCRYFNRCSYENLLLMQKKSYIVIDLYGDGLKCFRNTESTINSVSAKQDPTKVIFAYPWIDKENCIVLPVIEGSNCIDQQKSVDILLNYINGDKKILYEIYLRSLDTNRLYAPYNYVPNHIIKNITETI